MRLVIGLTIVFGGIAMILWLSGPRLISDVWHRDFVPAQGYTITSYECTNVNAVMFNHCTVTFVSQQSRERQQITDWRFGRAPQDPIQLLQRRDDPSAVTTDVSLRTLWNRVLLALMVVVGGIFLAIGLIAKLLKGEDAPIDAPNDGQSGEPARQPMGRSVRGPALRPTNRSSFGKRGA